MCLLPLVFVCLKLLGSVHCRDLQQRTCAIAQRYSATANASTYAIIISLMHLIACFQGVNSPYMYLLLAPLI
jgi:hypothetical protein